MSKKREYLSQILVKLFLLTAFIFPMVTLIQTRPDPSASYPQIIVPNILALLLIIVFFLNGTLEEKKRNNYKYLFFVLSIITVCYLFFYLMAIRSINWEWNLINVLISFLFFLSFIWFDSKPYFDKYNIIQFLIYIILIANIIGMFLYFSGVMAVELHNWKINLLPLDFNVYGEYRFSWVYSHKSEYALMLILCLSFFITFKEKFKNRIIYALSICFLLFCLYISHVYTSLFGAFIIISGRIIDYICHSKNYKMWLLTLIPFSGIFFAFFRKMNVERNLLTLGGRVDIWKASIKMIQNYANGVGTQFRSIMIPVNQYWKVDNCHNVFLNEAFRFSIPVGASYALFFLIIMLTSLIHKFSFFRLSIWIAFILATGMDYAMFTTDLTVVLFMIYCIFFISINNSAGD